MQFWASFWMRELLNLHKKHTGNWEQTNSSWHPQAFHSGCHDPWYMGGGNSREVAFLQRWSFRRFWCSQPHRVEINRALLGIADHQRLAKQLAFFTRRQGDCGSRYFEGRYVLYWGLPGLTSPGALCALLTSPRALCASLTLLGVSIKHIGPPQMSIIAIIG